MNIIKLISAVIVMFLACNVSATKYLFVATDNSIGTQLCVTAGNNDKSKLKSMIRNIHLNYSVAHVANNVKCNDMIISHFAKKYEANDTFLYLNRSTMQRNKLPQTKVTISDLAMVVSENEETIIISIGGS